MIDVLKDFLDKAEHKKEETLKILQGLHHDYLNIL